IEPSRSELRSSQTFWILGREKLGHDTIGPNKLPFRELIVRTSIRRVHCQDSGDPLNHDATDLIERFADKGDSAIAWPNCSSQRFGLRSYPLGACPRLSRSASADNKPRAPGPAVRVGFRRQLIIARPRFPIPGQKTKLIERKRRKRVSKVIKFYCVFAVAECAPQFRGGGGPLLPRRGCFLS